MTMFQPHRFTGRTPAVLRYRASIARTVLVLLPVLAAVGCGEGRSSEETDSPRATAIAEARTPVHIDSTFPIEEEIRRFRAELTEPSRLEEGASSRDDLVELFLRRLEAGDTTGVASLAITPAEFAWFYYPHTMYVSRPYELPPGLVWYQLQNRSSQGMARLLRSYAGNPLFDTGYRCPDEGEPFGDGHVWHGCAVFGEVPTGESVEERLFGSILEVEGLYKLVSFSNEL